MHSVNRILPSSPAPRKETYLHHPQMMYRSFQNETNPLPKLWIRISDSESESVIPNPRNQSESNSDSRFRFRGYDSGIHHESDSADSFLLVVSFLLLGIGSGRSFWGSGSSVSFRSERLITIVHKKVTNKRKA
ncbi:hypothetical protein AVEN_88025-1 [Araneus ventricosus]|uniref:Uncharacterized protein n=1 Tax=Araneus ventricosus TaxID=182803 RepID=A0A4Y2TXJ9_ARAVE|nr:hypothetical protein AVEN_88025-1 [Araneus ventricosus]